MRPASEPATECYRRIAEECQEEIAEKAGNE
jgi:hypothetical protein